MMNDSTRRRTLKGIGAILAGVSLAGCGGGDSGDGDSGNGDGSGETTVDMTDDLLFEPESITVDVGTTVVWDNVGNTAHTVTAYEDEIPDDAAYFASGGYDSEDAAREGWTPGDEESGDIPGGETYEHTFETPGTYEYFCIPHESSMVGTIEVEDA